MNRQTMNDLLFICAETHRVDRLIQLGEECTELGHAALKLARVLTGKSPTPITQAQAEAALMEEMGDVLSTIHAAFPDEVVGTGGHIQMLEDSAAFKLARWAARLENARNEPGAPES